MTAKRRGLGRGLDMLLSGAAPVVGDSESLRNLPIDLIRPGPYQPRQDMREDTLQELADSIRAQGLVQPILVRPLGDGEQFEIVAGERRWRAAQMAGLQEISSVVRRVPDKAAIAMALIENIQREDLNPLEEALALDRLIREFDMTHQQAANAIGRSRAAVSNLLRLLDLGAPLKKLLMARELDMGHARALLGLPTQRQQTEVGLLVAKKGLSVRETEALVRRLLSGKKDRKPARRDPDIARLETELSEKLGAKVSLSHGVKGKGKLVVSYNSLDELEGILAHIK
ncbi:MAG: ParB/RepB/Spo0J family partition protein [Gammaproteobacteria bacterium]|nr:ParB/RepB/Spo0J family partition protein [Gammaproteobacteria bacterium]